MEATLELKLTYSVGNLVDVIEKMNLKTKIEGTNVSFALDSLISSSPSCSFQTEKVPQLHRYESICFFPSHCITTRTRSQTN